MITFKCKMCGGDLTFEPGASVAEYPYCGTNQTLPKLDDDKRANLYDRANHFRRQNEFDKAMAIYVVSRGRFSRHTIRGYYNVSDNTSIVYTISRRCLEY